MNFKLTRATPFRNLVAATTLIAAGVGLATAQALAQADSPVTKINAEAAKAASSARGSHTRPVNIDGLDIFYREAGSPANPTVLLLHGFPTSSQMFRNLMPQLAGRYHLVAPDYPGYGNSSAPPVDKFDYTFDNLANVVDKFAQALKLERYSLYVMDYGAPVGYRLAVNTRSACKP